MAAVLAQHPPAMKVAGRRLSVSSRPRPNGHTDAKPSSPTADAAVEYPRSTAPGEEASHNEQHEEPPKKEKKRGGGGDEHERRLQESLYRKAEQNRPKRHFHGAKNLNAVGAGGRIAQPMGRQMTL